MAHRPKKSFGQNFLQDDHVIHQIIDAIAPKQSDILIEIGPGQGALTGGVLARLGDTGQLTVIELDKHLIPGLQQLSSQYSAELQIIEQDALTIDFSALIGSGGLGKVFGNLPYNISTPLLFQCLESAANIKQMIFMLQKEVVDRIVATPGNKQYGRLSIMIQYYCEAVALFDVSPHCFFPEPKVMSAIVELKPHRVKPSVARDEILFADIVRAAFNQRRKTLNNSLKEYLLGHSVGYYGFSETARAEELSVADYVTLANHLDPL